MFSSRLSECTGSLSRKQIRVSEEKAKLNAPDLTQGVELSTVPNGTVLLGYARGDSVLLVRRGDELFAIDATCTHYGAPLEQWLLVGDTVRCPWHHVCFSLSTGEVLRAPTRDRPPVGIVRHASEHLAEPMPPRPHGQPFACVAEIGQPG